jgi:hypothetical protein
VSSRLLGNIHDAGGGAEWPYSFCPAQDSLNYGQECGPERELPSSRKLVSSLSLKLQVVNSREFMSSPSQEFLGQM